jgi:hypothetical protein
MNNPWKNFNFEQKKQVHELDQEVFDAFNQRVSKLKNGLRLKLSSDHTPLPFFGNAGANFVILMANPGLDPVNTAKEEKPALRRLFDQARKQEKMTSPFVFLDDAFVGTPGHTWWSKRLKKLIEQVGLEKVQKGIFSAEIHPYKSINYKALHAPLPTQAYTANLVRDHVNNGSLILMGRARKEWIELVPELEKYKNVIHLNSKQSSYITPGNTAPGDFDKIVKALLT